MGRRGSTIFRPRTEESKEPKKVLEKFLSTL